MPHIVIEYTNNLEEELKQADLLSTVHHTAIQSGLFSARAIKTRLREIDDYIIGEHPKSTGSFIHISVALLQGRIPEQKLALSQSLHKILKSKFPKADSLSVDVRDMDKTSYSKL